MLAAERLWLWPRVVIAKIQNCEYVGGRYLVELGRHVTNNDMKSQYPEEGSRGRIGGPTPVPTTSYDYRYTVANNTNKLQHHMLHYHHHHPTQHM